MHVQISRIIVTNFKSYYGQVSIDISERFVCIVGKNGSGKSALMDAVCWIFGSRAHAIRTDNSSQLINDRSRAEGNKEVYYLADNIMNRKAEVQFTLFDVAPPPSEMNPQEAFKSIPMLQDANSYLVFTIGRRLHNRTMEYYGRFGNSDPFTIRFADISVILEALHIQISTREKFIIQQSELLLNIRQRNTYLLEVIEECIGDQEIVAVLNDLNKRHEALCVQKESVRSRLEELSQYLEVHQPERLLANRVKETEKKVNELKMGTESIRRKERGLRRTLLLRLEQDYPSVIQQNETKMTSVVNELDVITKQIAKKEEQYNSVKKKKQDIDSKLDFIQDEIAGIENERRLLKRKLRQEQEKLIHALDQQKEVKQELNKESQLRKEFSQNVKCKEEDIMDYVESFRILQKERECCKEIDDLEKMEKELESKIEKEKEEEQKRLVLREIHHIQHRIQSLHSSSPPAVPVLPSSLQYLQLMIKSLSSSKIHGLLITLPIRVISKQYILPASIAIQKALKNVVVVEDRSTALQVVDQLRKKQGGVITCIILSELTHMKWDVPNIPKTKPLIDVISCPVEYQLLVQKLFGKWILAESDDEAIAVERKTHGWNCVTMDGVMYLANGEVRQWEEKGLLKLQSVESTPSDAKQDEREKQMLEEKLQELRKQVGNVDYVSTEDATSLRYKRESIQSSLEQKKKHHMILLQRVKHNLSLTHEQEQVIQQFSPSFSPQRIDELEQRLQALKEQVIEFQASVDAAELALEGHKKQYPLKKQKKECKTLEKESEAIEASMTSARNALKKLRVKQLLLVKEKEKLEKAIQREKKNREERNREIQSIHEDAIIVPQGCELAKWEEAAQMLSKQQEKVRSASHILEGLHARQDLHVLETLDTYEVEQTEMEKVLKVISSDLMACENEVKQKEEERFTRLKDAIASINQMLSSLFQEITHSISMLIHHTILNLG